MLNENINQKENNHVLINKFTDWTNFKQLLYKKIKLDVVVRTEEDLEVEVQKDIQITAWEYTPDVKND